MGTDSFLYHCIKLKSKWIKEVHIKPETLKPIEEKVGKNLDDTLLSPCKKIKFKWIKDLHIKPDTLKLIEKKVW